MPRIDQRPYHRQVLAQNGDRVDEGIVYLLEALWDYGIDTSFSCQDWGEVDGPKLGWAYIKFTTEDDAKLFCSDLNEHERYGHPLAGGALFVTFPSKDIKRLQTLWRYRGAAFKDPAET